METITREKAFELLKKYNKDLSSTDLRSRR